MRKRTLIVSATLAILLSIIISVKTYASMLMGTAFVILGGIIAMTIFTGGAATLISTQQGVYPRGGIYGSGQTPGQTVASPNGNIGRAGTVQWIDVRDIDMSTLSPKVKQADVTLKASAAKMMDAAKADPSKYPKLSNLSAPVMPPDYEPSYEELPGQSIDVGGRSYRIANVGGSNGGSSCFQNGYIESSGSGLRIETVGDHRFYVGWSPGGSLQCGDNYTPYRYSELDLGTSSSPSVPVPPSPAQFAAKLANSSGVLLAPENVFSDYYGEIDDYLQSHPGNVSVVGTDDPSQVDSAPPYNMPSPASQAAVSAATALANGAAATAAANNAVSVAQANYNANPTPQNAQTLADAQAAAAQAAAAQAELQRELDSLDTSEVDDAADTALSGLGENVYPTEYDQPEKKGLSDLLSQFVSSSPLSSMVRSFSIGTSGGESSFSAGIVYGRELNFSFTRWEPYLRMCGAALIVVAHGFAVMVVVRGW